MKYRSLTDNVTRNKSGNNVQPVMTSFMKQGGLVAQAVCSDIPQLSPA